MSLRDRPVKKQTKNNNTFLASNLSKKSIFYKENAKEKLFFLCPKSCLTNKNVLDDTNDVLKK